MAGAWQQSMGRTTDMVIAAHGNNPNVNKLGAILQNAMADKFANRNLARQATYQRYPAVAAQQAGLAGDVAATGGTGVPAGMAGMEMSGMKIGESGQPSYEFQNPELTDKDILGAYTRYITDVQKQNQENELFSKMSKQQATPVRIPTLQEFRNELLAGIDQDIITSQAPPEWLDTLSEEEMAAIQQIGVDMDSVTLTATKYGMSKEQMFEFLRSNFGGNQ